MKLHTEIPNTWSNARKIIFRCTVVFVLLILITLPFKRYVLPDIGKHLQFVFEPLVKFSAKHIFHLQHSYTSSITSDATGMYIHFFNMAVVAILVSLVWTMIDKQRKNYIVLSSWFRAVCSYYLALQLLVYGCSKLFQWQFYTPEPNTLFTTLGNTPKDLLYWSAIGTSSVYSIFCGMIEVVPALLLLFRKTRTLGASIAALVLLNVVMLNVGFDISVKLYSSFLLLIALIVAAPALYFLMAQFGNGKAVALKVADASYNKIMPKHFYVPIKTLVLAALVIEVLYPYISTKNFNDKVAAKPVLFGAYEVDSFYKNNVLVPPLTTDTVRWRRIFVHSKGYFITQHMNDAMQDYNMETDTLTKRFAIEHTQNKMLTIFSYKLINDTILEVDGTMYNDSIRMLLKKINLQQLPALKKEFNWTIDE
jgi:hypothetical protein